MHTIKCTISGSFRRFLPEIHRKIEECTSLGIEVISPVNAEEIAQSEGFIFLHGDHGTPKDIELKHLRAIQESDFLYIVNPEGYIGTSTTLEIGYAIAHSIPTFCFENPAEPILRLITTVQSDIKEINQKILEEEYLDLPKNISLWAMQSYIRKVVKLRGFENETLRDVALLLMEEIGELAKAIRREIGLTVDISRSENYGRISDELVDCLVYLVDIANLANIDLEKALREKEKANEKRKWQKNI